MTDPSQPNWGPSTHGAIRHHEGEGWVLFAGIMIIILGVLNVIWGLAAIDNSKFFVANATFILTSLNTWGWITLLVGVAEVFAAFSIWRGGQVGRWFGIGIASLNVIVALLSISAYPFWGLAVFIVALLVIYGLAAYGGDRSVAE